MFRLGLLSSCALHSTKPLPELSIAGCVCRGTITPSYFVGYQHLRSQLIVIILEWGWISGTLNCSQHHFSRDSVKTPLSSWRDCCLLMECTEMKEIALANKESTSSARRTMTQNITVRVWCTNTISKKDWIPRQYSNWADKAWNPFKCFQKTRLHVIQYQTEPIRWRKCKLKKNDAHLILSGFKCAELSSWTIVVTIKTIQR